MKDCVITKIICFQNWVNVVCCFFTLVADNNKFLNNFNNTELEKAEEVYRELTAAHPDFLAAHISLINKLDPTSDVKNQLPFTYAATVEKITDVEAAKAVQQRIVSLADLVINGTDTAALLAFYGMKTDNRADATKIKT